MSHYDQGEQLLAKVDAVKNADPTVLALAAIGHLLASLTEAVEVLIATPPPSEPPPEVLQQFTREGQAWP